MCISMSTEHKVLQSTKYKVQSTKYKVQSTKYKVSSRASTATAIYASLQTFGSLGSNLHLPLKNSFWSQRLCKIEHLWTQLSFCVLHWVMSGQFWDRYSEHSRQQLFAPLTRAKLQPYRPEHTVLSIWYISDVQCATHTAPLTSHWPGYELHLSMGSRLQSVLQPSSVWLGR